MNFLALTIWPEMFSTEKLTTTKPTLPTDEVDVRKAFLFFSLNHKLRLRKGTSQNVVHSPVYDLSEISFQAIQIAYDQYSLFARSSRC